MTPRKSNRFECPCGAIFDERWPQSRRSPQNATAYCSPQCYYKYESSVKSLRGAPHLKCPSCDRQFDVSAARSDQWCEASQTWHCSRTCAQAFANARQLRRTRRCEWCGKYACDGSFSVGQRQSERLACSPECADAMVRGSRDFLSKVVDASISALKAQGSMPAPKRALADVVSEKLQEHLGHGGRPVGDLSRSPDERFVSVRWLQVMLERVVHELKEEFKS